MILNFSLSPLLIYAASGYIADPETLFIFISPIVGFDFVFSTSIWHKSHEISINCVPAVNTFGWLKQKTGLERGRPSLVVMGKGLWTLVLRTGGAGVVGEVSTTSSSFSHGVACASISPFSKGDKHLLVYTPYWCACLMTEQGWFWCCYECGCTRIFQILLSVLLSM